tara:strand:+ start:1753 stop:2211 length:459 start_codon:yes stop_codon:yes gene_type:complete
MKEIIIAINRKAKFNYNLLQGYTAGVQLKGHEVKSIKQNQVSLKESYCVINNNEIWIKNMHISEYKHNSEKEYNPIRTRKLLLNKLEIEKINKKSTIKGHSIIPVKIIINQKGLIKIKISLAKGKNIHDKRKSIKEKDIKKNTDIDLKKRAL